MPEYTVCYEMFGRWFKLDFKDFDLMDKFVRMLEERTKIEFYVKDNILGEVLYHAKMPVLR